eukprot:TRINITY_DN6580_c0_g1_i10.p1 TRINITY_DN6580_c0_g1~~TRINITY_DN6580_c0_g1_i10.p1  ORF type:complete len:219 (+),score=42.70 TRINITY_DN6580_c0_g1_i10:231-887(+)
MDKICASKLTKELAKLRRDPLPGVAVSPNESNIREWHFCLLGHKESPYRGGVFHGKLLFPPEYPMKPPSIFMFTPNGRFDTNVRICTSYSDYHPESWNPAWSCATILIGLQSFMLEDSPSAGCISRSEAIRKQLASNSLEFNQANHVYRRAFDPDAIAPMIEEACTDLTDQERTNSSSNCTASGQDITGGTVAWAEVPSFVIFVGIIGALVAYTTLYQ